MKHLILFDLDQTLVKSEMLDIAAYKQVMYELYTIEDFSFNVEDYTHGTDSYILQEIANEKFGRYLQDYEIDIFKAAFAKKIFANDFHPIEGAIELLKNLDAHDDFLYGVATGSFEEIAMHKLVSSGFDPNIDLKGSDVFHAKIDIINALREQIAHKYNKEFASCTYIGNSLYDYSCSMELGINFIGIGDNENLRILADNFIKDFTELKLDQLTQARASDQEN